MVLLAIKGLVGSGLVIEGGARSGMVPLGRGGGMWRGGETAETSNKLCKETHKDARRSCNLGIWEAEMVGLKPSRILSRRGDWIKFIKVGGAWKAWLFCLLPPMPRDGDNSRS
jgi:hypothetical protein